MNSLPATATRAVPLALPHPPSLQFADFLRQIATHGSTIELRRKLTTTEQQTLRARSRELLPFLAGTTSAKLRDSIARCFTGFGYAPSNPEEAAAIAAQYLTVLQGMPLWAVEKACMKFASGNVRPEDVGAKRLDLSARPSTAQLKTIVSDLLEPVAGEVNRIHMILNAPVGRSEPDPEARARTLKSIEAWRARNGVPEKPKPEADAERLEIAERADARHREKVLAEYIAAGLDPPEEKPGKMLCSLALLLQMGWRIEEVRGKKVLTAPPTPKQRQAKRPEPSDDLHPGF